MSATVESGKSTQDEVLENLAVYAESGIRAIFLVGKLKSLPKRRANTETGEITVKAEVICGEGDTLPLKFDPLGPIPGAGHQGCFLIDVPSEFNRYKSANCLAWK